jgi:hypothetical protein
MATESQRRPLSADQLALCLQLLTHIVRVAAPAESRNIASLSLSAPREDGRMAPTGTLTFNDAPWLSTGLLNKEAVQFVHGSVDAEFAATLGVKSLRELLLVNKSLKKDIVCMSAAQVRAQLSARMPAHAFLLGTLWQREEGNLIAIRKSEHVDRHSFSH